MGFCKGIFVLNIYVKNLLRWLQKEILEFEIIFLDAAANLSLDFVIFVGENIEDELRTIAAHTVIPRSPKV